MSFIFYILFSCVFGFILLPKSNKIDRYVLSILLISCVSEILKLYIKNDPFTSSKIINNIYVGLTFIFWLFIIGAIHKNNRVIQISIAILIAYILVNPFKIQKFLQFDHYAFILGSFIYCLIFLITSFKKLKNDDLDYFKSNNFILLFAPILFFIGLSFVFGFQDTEASKIMVLGKFELYSIISYFVNIVYYSLINLYILRLFLNKRKT